MGAVYTTKQSPKKTLQGKYLIQTGSTVRTQTSIYSGTQTTTSYRTSGADVNLRATLANGRYRGFYSKYDNGNSWLLTRKRVYEPKSPTLALTGRNGAWWTGKIQPNTSHFPGWGTSLNVAPVGNLPSYGPTAVSRTAPTNPNMDLAASLSEFMREGLPRVSRLSEYVNPLRTGAADNLALQFGVVPLVNEIKSLVRICLNATDLIEQYNRDSGRHIRRKIELKNERVILQSLNGNVGLFADNTLANNLAKNPSAAYTVEGVRPPATMITSSHERVWFAGAYEYASPLINLEGVAKYRAQANKLLGLTLDLNTLWELAPWSWLIDWFTTIGDAINVADALSTDGLVMHYGYLMRSFRYEKTLTVPLWHAYDGSVLTDISLTKVDERKERIRANPYGFGVSADSLNMRQLGILASLGLTRLG